MNIIWYRPYSFQKEKSGSSFTVVIISVEPQISGPFLLLYHTIRIITAAPTARTATTTPIMTKMLDPLLTYSEETTEYTPTCSME